VIIIFVCILRLYGIRDLENNLSTHGNGHTEWPAGLRRVPKFWASERHHINFADAKIGVVEILQMRSRGLRVSAAIECWRRSMGSQICGWRKFENE
jgi:hypothetical protein